MRILSALAVSTALALIACSPAAAPGDASAQTALTDADKAAILTTLSLSANAQGQVENECGERVTPQYVPTDLGSGVGRAVAFVIGGGPNTVSCYGDGSLVQLMRWDGSSWREIYMNRGGSMIVLPTTHHNANDLADGGPGFSFPVWEWNGNEYVSANRTVPDSALNDARFVP
jgi:hypothetical protein